MAGRPKGQPKTGGREKGTPNKMTASVKEAIEFAAQELGGGERLAAWAKASPDNEKTFWASIYPKLLPLQVNGTVMAEVHEHRPQLLPPLTREEWIAKYVNPAPDA